MAETGMIRIKAKQNCRVAVLTDGVPTTLGARVRYDKVIEQTKSANSPSKQTKKPHFWGFNYCGGDGEIRTLVQVTQQTHFECVPVRPLRYVSKTHIV